MVYADKWTDLISFEKNESCTTEIDGFLFCTFKPLLYKVFGDDYDKAKAGSVFGSLTARIANMTYINGFLEIIPHDEGDYDVSCYMISFSDIVRIDEDNPAIGSSYQDLTIFSNKDEIHSEAIQKVDLRDALQQWNEERNAEDSEFDDDGAEVKFYINKEKLVKLLDQELFDMKVKKACIHSILNSLLNGEKK